MSIQQSLSTASYTQCDTIVQLFLLMLEIKLKHTVGSGRARLAGQHDQVSGNLRRHQDVPFILILLTIFSTRILTCLLSIFKSTF